MIDTFPMAELNTPTTDIFDPTKAPMRHHAWLQVMLQTIKFIFISNKTLHSKLWHIMSLRFTRNLFRVQFKIQILQDLIVHFCLVVVQSFLTLNMLNCFKDGNRCVHISYGILDFIQQKRPKNHNATALHVACPILSIPGLLMPWRFKSPGYQQVWYWPPMLEYSISIMGRVKISWVKQLKWIFWTNEI